MTTFADSVVYALGQLLEILREADNAQSEIDDLQEYLVEASEQLDTLWDDLEQKAEDLFDRANYLTDSLQEQTELMETKFNDFQARLQNWQQLYQTTREDTQTTLTLFQDNIEISRQEIVGLLSESTDALEEMTEQAGATELELETALTKSEEFFNRVILTLLVKNREDLEKDADKIEELIERDVQESFSSNIDNLRVSIEENSQSIEEKMNLLEPLKAKFQEGFSAHLNDYDEVLEELAEQLTSNAEDKQFQIEEKRKVFESILDDLRKNYLDTGEKITEVIELLESAIKLKRTY